MLLRPKRKPDRKPNAGSRTSGPSKGDIKGCFDNIDHHGLMERVRRRVGDPKVNRLVLAFLKAGILSEEQFLRTRHRNASRWNPLAAARQHRAERHRGAVRAARVAAPARRRSRPTPASDRTAGAPRTRNDDRRRGRDGRASPFGTRMTSSSSSARHRARADRAGPRSGATRRRPQLAAILKEQARTWSSRKTKTLVTPVTKPMRFLGHHVRVRRHPGPRTAGQHGGHPEGPKPAAPRTHQGPLPPRTTASSPWRAACAS